ncbi:hypothetical protein BO82DRAFT_28630 [Aspergillus uvarum CBS 121591]|uniref:Uncharacterized protein n=1 Tax=Aspergillus uvarum CBS 121591 TaxID=1448315 RepID=A0A319CDN2_9EURO|nr:hypothetical protein BO82DRAFT_28630 [Aspergillus uvarum CBS 121591]PYH83916.1 hypothetical protein BO82DRAFT_28630 [Aspergillus uvarum CBS 121591]
MVQLTTLHKDLVKVTQATRIVMRCLSTGRDSQETSQKALTLLTDVLEILYRIKDQTLLGEEKWHVDSMRLEGLGEILGWLQTTMQTIEHYFQPGGVNVAYFRKHLLERTFLPQLEQYKILLLLAMQPDSDDRSSLDQEIRYILKLSQDLDCGPKVDLKFEENALGLTNDFKTPVAGYSTMANTEDGYWDPSKRFTVLDRLVRARHFSHPPS